MSLDTELLHRAMDLPVELRAELARKLLVSLEKEDIDLGPEWTAEIGRRVDEMDAGEQGVELETAFARIRSSLRRRA